MRTLRDIDQLRSTLRDYRQRGQRIALVPTMGNLHAGHLALVACARQHADIAQTRVHVPVVGEGLCGGSRPGHFDGVSTVVSMLFNLVQPDVACFGEKDYQQLAVIRKLVCDLHMPIEIIGVPIVRAEDGLALSSRNGYLSSEERAIAPALYRTLCTLRDALERGEPIEKVLHQGNTALYDAGFTLDYLELRDVTLGPINLATRHAVLLAAAKLGPARLIDNLTVQLPASAATTGRE
jgi:pantoate--beta-alanine ligase